MAVQVKHLQGRDLAGWDAFVRQHPHATPYHLACWKSIIEKTYGHRTHFLVALRNQGETRTQRPRQEERTNPSCHDTAKGNGTVAGVLPLVHLKHVLFGNSLISLPFFDLGGVLAEDEEAERALISEAVRIGLELKAERIEFRHTHRHPCLQEKVRREARAKDGAAVAFKSKTHTHKVRMLLTLPGSAEKLMESFKSKLKSQVRKPVKEGLSATVGGPELLDDFYRVFVVNMRDLGSPVHSKKLMDHLLDELREETRLVIVRKAGIPLACSLIITFGETLYNPWASALREYSRFSPNMLLYWTMMEYACEKGLSRFDFGRSTPGEGTYKFKEQWGAVPETLHWQYVILRGTEGNGETLDGPRFAKAVRLWSRLPVPITRWIGPMIRKHIGL